MKVAMYYNNKDIRIQEQEIPKIDDDEILVKIIAGGICGSDVMEWYRIKKAPLVLGHEISGVIEKIGKNVKNFTVNDKVFVSHHVPCMKCNYCLNEKETACETLHKTNFDPGGFSEYIRIPKINVELGTIKLPDNVSFDEGTFIEPLGCIIRGQRLANLDQNDSLLIIGSGISGLIHIALAKSKGIKKIIAMDINGYRLNAAKKFGADFVINADEDILSKIKDINNNKLADIVIVCTGSIAAAKQALKCVDKGGTIMFFAVPKPEDKIEIPINDFWRNQIKIITSYGAAPRDLKESIKVIESKKINFEEMVTHKLPLSETGKGFKIVAEAKESIKVIIEPNK